jgi:NADH dehydrogenase FAD-containing subunit
MSITRRNFIKAAGASAALLAAGPRLARAAGAYRVVVIGGGFAGATVAKYLRMWSGRAIDVTLVDPNPAHTTCVLSNLVLNGRMKLSELQMPLSRLYTNHGVTVLQDTAVAIDAVGHEVVLATAGRKSYDRLVLAPGISFDKLPGWDPDTSPIQHAWVAGPQTTKLRQQLLTLRKGDTFVMTIPLAPYRCPPGPYERACVVADMLKRLGGGKVIVLDANREIVAEKHTFDTAFKTIYKDIVEYHPATPISSVDSANLAVNRIKGKVVNVIAPHRAPALLSAADAMLTNSDGWAPVNPLTYETTQLAGSGIHVIGDSCAAPVQPKSGHMANSQAKVCADAIVRYSLGFDPLADKERTANITTNSACYSPVTYSEASWLTANYRYDATQDKMVLTTPTPGEAPKWDGENFEDMFTWASNLFTDSFT